jgi:2,3-bisphosphoglycerate-independent phosphoglycerate mutase
MKYAIIIPDGAADEPLPELSGKTPLEAAKKPNSDWIALHGRQGTARTVPDGFESGSDVATMSLLGYDPAKYHTGRAPLEAAARDIKLDVSDYVFRCNLVTVVDGVMKDHSAGGITDAEAQTLIHTLASELKPRLGEDWEFHTGVSYRNLLVKRNGDFDLTTKPPHEIPDTPIDKYLPRGKGAEILNEIMARSAQLFAHHEINAVRKQTGLNPASQVWLWGQGKAPYMDNFATRYGIKGGGCMITGVDLLRGLARLIGWSVHEVPGMTSFHDTDYAAQGRETAAILDQYDIVVSHIESPDEASHQADWKTKVEAIEAIDHHVVGPVLKKLQTYPEWRILVLPDHPTNIATRKHGYAPTCWTMAGTRVGGLLKAPWSEKNAANSDLRIERGHELMEFFLKGGNL